MENYDKNYDLKYSKKYYIGTLNQLKKYIQNYYNNILNIYKTLTQIIDNCIGELSNIEDSIPQNPKNIRYNPIYLEFKGKYHLITDINLKNDSLFNRIDKIYNSLINFNFFPVKENSFDFNISPCLPNENSISKADTHRSICNFYDYENSNNTYLEDNSKNHKCSKCWNNNAKFIYKKKNDLYCKDCYEDSEYKFDGKEIDENNETLADRADFLNSMINLIKFIILECDEILKIKKNKEKIKIKVDYSKIDNIQQGYFNFLVDINECIRGEVNTDKFKLANLEEDTRQKIGDLFKRDVNFKINLEQEEDEDVDDSSGELVNEVYNENSEHNEEPEKEKNKEKKKLDEEILNNFYYFINIIPKNNSKFDDNAKKQLENKLKVKINPNNFIVSNNNKYFIDNIVRNDNFLNLSLEEIKNLYPNFEELYEYKNIVNYLIKECDIKNYIDCKGNFIIKINDKVKPKEAYYPPYEWIGIGLKIKNKEDYLNFNYNDNEWAIAYYGVGGGLPVNEVKDKLKSKIKNGLEQGNWQSRCHLEDIRHPGKKIGVGVYLTPNCNLVENYCGIINFNKEKYRVALMVKVRIDKIKEPKDINIWILNSKYIRPYRILLKKLNKCFLR